MCTPRAAVDAFRSAQGRKEIVEQLVRCVDPRGDPTAVLPSIAAESRALCLGAHDPVSLLTCCVPSFDATAVLCLPPKTQAWCKAQRKCKQDSQEQQDNAEAVAAWAGALPAALHKTDQFPRFFDAAAADGANPVYGFASTHARVCNGACSLCDDHDVDHLSLPRATGVNADTDLDVSALAKFIAPARAADIEGLLRAVKRGPDERFLIFALRRIGRSFTMRLSATAEGGGERDPGADIVSDHVTWTLKLGEALRFRVWADGACASDAGRVVCTINCQSCNPPPPPSLPSPSLSSLAPEFSGCSPASGCC